MNPLSRSPRLSFGSALLLPLALAFAACGDAPPPAAPGGAAPVAARSYLLSREPEGAISVNDALARPVGETVTVVGRLQKKVKALASFILTDDAVLDCLRCGMPGGCKTPWDYCCHKDEMRRSSIAVELQLAPGQPAPVSDWGIRELDLVVVRGVLAKGEGTRPVLLAQDGWYQRERPKTPEGLRWP